MKLYYEDHLLGEISDEDLKAVEGFRFNYGAPYTEEEKIDKLLDLVGADIQDFEHRMPFNFHFENDNNFRLYKVVVRPLSDRIRGKYISQRLTLNQIKKLAEFYYDIPYEISLDGKILDHDQFERVLHAKELGKIGGSVKSKAKSSASRENGKKGGRPKKNSN